MATIREFLLKLARCAAPVMLALTVALIIPLVAFADDEAPKPDARLEGYQSPVALNDGGTGLTTVFLILLTLIVVGVMFINAKRSHLD